MKSLVVAKFGGSSVKNSDSIKRCAELVLRDSSVKICILSATYNTTNELEELAAKSILDDKTDALAILSRIKERHFELSYELSINQDYLDRLESIFLEAKFFIKQMITGVSLTPASSDMDNIYAWGERMSSLIFAGTLLEMSKDNEVSIYCIDARKIVKTDSRFNRARPNIELIKEGCLKMITPLLDIETSRTIVITQGFIGSNSEGKTTTLGREGSDYSAALIAEGVGATSVYIWTDVQGVMSTDPRVDKSAKLLKEISYEFAEMLAHLGAKVLFPKTLAPVKRANIPLYVGSSLEGELGTVISKTLLSETVAKSKITNLTLIKILMSDEFELSSMISFLEDSGVVYNIVNVGSYISIMVPDEFYGANLESKLSQLSYSVNHNCDLISYLGDSCLSANFYSNRSKEFEDQNRSFLLSFTSPLSLSILVKGHS